MRDDIHRGLGISYKPMHNSNVRSSQLGELLLYNEKVEQMASGKPRLYLARRRAVIIDSPRSRIRDRAEHVDDWIVDEYV